MDCATESPRVLAPGPESANVNASPPPASPPPTNFEILKPRGRKGTRDHLGDRIRQQVHAMQPVPLDVVYIVSSPARKPQGASRRLCQHGNRRRICLDCHADRHARFGRVLIMLAQQQLGPVAGYAAALSCDVYQRVECWEAWLCGFWPWWDRRRKTADAASNDFQCFRWFLSLGLDERMKFVKQSRKAGCDRMERRRALRRMITDAANFNVSVQPHQGGCSCKST